MAVKMDQKTIIVLAVVGSLGVLSAILGISGELSNICETKVGIGVCAFIFLIISQVIFAVVGGCCGFWKSRANPSEINLNIGVVCAIASWIATVIAFALLVVGVSSSQTSGWTCYVPQGIFVCGGLLALAATALGITSYVMLRRQPDAAAKAGDEQLPAGGAGIAMGQPQFPEQSPPQGYGHAPPPNYAQYSPPPNYPQYSPPPQGPYGQASNGQFSTPPPPAHGYGAHAANQQSPPPPPAQAQRYGAHAANQQSPPPAHGYAPNQQYPPPTHGYAPTQQYPPPAHGYAPNKQYHSSPRPTRGYAPAHAPNQQAPPPQGYEQVEEGPEVAAEVAQGEPDGSAWTSEPVGDAGAEPVGDSWAAQ